MLTNRSPHLQVWVALLSKTLPRSPHLPGVGSIANEFPSRDRPRHVPANGRRCPQDRFECLTGTYLALCPPTRYRGIHGPQTRCPQRRPVAAALWPETIQAMEWLASERRTVELEGNPWVLLLESGKRPTGGDIANRWSKLLDRVKKDHANFRRLPFKYLRKTAYQLVLEVSSSHEVAGTFQGRGQLASDEHADVYGRRLFGRVFEANNLVRSRLAPMFQAAPPP